MSAQTGTGKRWTDINFLMSPIYFLIRLILFIPMLVIFLLILFIDIVVMIIRLVSGFLLGLALMAVRGKIEVFGRPWYSDALRVTGEAWERIWRAPLWLFSHNAYWSEDRKEKKRRGESQATPS